MLRFEFVIVCMMPLLSSIKANTTTPSQIGTSTSLQTATESVSSVSRSTQPAITLCNKTYTRYTDEERTCFTGLQCKYGKCDKGSGFSCICDAGATGLLCNDECCLDCGDHGNCFYDSLNDEELCSCEFGYTGDRCGERILLTSTNPSTEELLPTSSNPSTEECSLQCPAGLRCVTGVSGDTCVLPTTISSLPSSMVPKFTLCNKAYTMHTDEERTCFTGLQCKYGKCDKGSGFSCICDAGATGPLCNNECCLDCGDHGNCFYDSINGKELCNCEFGYSGERCHTQIDHSLPTSSPCSLDCPAGYKCTNLALQGASACTPIGSSTSLPLATGPPNQLCGESYQLRNLTERECPSGPHCKHGVCVAVYGSVTCECDDKAFGILCEYECCKDCGDNGACFYDSMLNEEICNCFSGFTGNNCSDVITTPGPVNSAVEPTWYLWVVGACVGVLIFLIILLVVTPYMLWRNRVILVMKIVHYFQGYEDDDEKEWDTFISYKSDPRDEDFVVNVLFPTLEREMGFKTHVHFRDFIPGDTIANNIIKAVQGSRRTILVVTPSFIKSEFTKFEYQVAQQEMLKQKHRIIPILLDDISGVKGDLDPNLKVILGSVTYLEWPKEETEKKVAKFWKRLQLSLPKKRTTNDQATDQDALKNTEMSHDIVQTAFDDKQHYIGNNVKDNCIILNIPECVDGEELGYDKIDDRQLDRQRDVVAKKDVKVNKYIEILENTRL